MRSRRIQTVFALAGLAVLVPTQSFAEVIEASPNGFAVKSVLTIAATRGKVYDALVQLVGRWWDPA